MNEIVLENLSFSYAQNAKKNIIESMNLTVSAADITVITGVSGCGKSTLLFLAAGLYPQNAGVIKSGQLTVNGIKISDLPSAQRTKHIGLIFQNPDLQFCMDTVKNELIFCLENIQMPPEKMDKRIEEALEFCKIAHLKERKLVSLSGGEKQKAMLACVAALRPKWILLDEPFANIDEESAKDILEKLRILHKEYGVGILAVDHHLGLWEDVASQLVVLDKDGTIIKQTKELSVLDAKELGICIKDSSYQMQAPKKAPVKLEPILKIRGLSVTKDNNKILNHLSTDFFKGRIHAMIGQSGSGKSTFFSALCGLQKYDGSILIKDEDIRKNKKMRSKIGFIFQSPQDQFVADTVFDEIAVGFRGEQNAEQKTEEILRSIKLWRYRAVSPYMISQGQQRRLGVAALLAYPCEVLVCDEPTYAQDAHNIIAIMDCLQQQVVKRGVTLIFSTHDRQLAKDYADIVYELKEGTLHEKLKSSL
ncbi:MAG: ATP-binding cassette domain-containing protein [Christensenellaceae bacterium]